ncbi:MAG: ArsA family ATPase, partial [Vicinamibacterales bacterium]
MRSASVSRGAVRQRSIPASTRSPASRRRSRADTSEKTTSRQAPRFHFIGGKGGVGKTTCSAAFAVHEALGGARVLIATTDPAPSLADAFKIPLSSSPRKIPLRTGTLHAVQIDAARALRRWIAQRYASLETIARDGTWLDAEDVTRILSLSLPGIDEIAALLELARYAQSPRFDLVIVDTAPTGHTLRMLDMPETLFGVARVFDSMREKHRVMVAALRGSVRKEREDLLIEGLASDARTLAAMLRHGDATRISWVSLPEPMAIAETRDALDALRTREMTVSDLIINRLTPAPIDARSGRNVRCGHCDARRSLEAGALEHIPGGAQRIIPLHERDSEPRGIPALRRLGKDLSRAAAIAPSKKRRTAPLMATI